jgi:hypothetical protein
LSFISVIGPLFLFGGGGGAVLSVFFLLFVFLLVAFVAMNCFLTMVYKNEKDMQNAAGAFLSCCSGQKISVRMIDSTPITRL